MNNLLQLNSLNGIQLQFGIFQLRWKKSCGFLLNQHILLRTGSYSMIWIDHLFRLWDIRKMRVTHNKNV